MIDEHIAQRLTTRDSDQLTMYNIHKVKLSTPIHSHNLEQGQAMDL